MGNPTTKTLFSVSAKSNDGVCLWMGVFECREDFDAFLWAIANGSLKNERALWDLPTPSWQPWMGELITYDFATTTFLTATTATSYSRPTDWNNANNSIETVGPGAPGNTITTSSSSCGGGGGGAYSKATNQTIDATNTYKCGPGTTTTSDVTYFKNNSSVTLCSAYGGVRGGAVSGGTGSSVGTGGLASSGVGSLKYNGGSAPSSISVGTATGAGGAASSAGAGGNGVAPGSAGGGAGGTSGSGLAGGTGGSGTSVVGGAGGNGTEWQVSPAYGCGSGGAGSKRDNQDTPGGSGGNYGGGGGGCNVVGGVAYAGSGRQGLVVITYTPGSSMLYNNPMLGM